MVRSIDPDDIPGHQNPIPAAAEHRGLFISSAIGGIDPATGRYPDDPGEQVAMAFAHLRRLLAAARVDLQDVVKMDLYFADKADRPLANRQWLAMYPDEAARPARHAHLEVLPDGCRLQIVVTAMVARD